MTTEMVTGKTKTWMWSDDHAALLAERDALRAALERIARCYPSRELGTVELDVVFDAIRADARAALAVGQ